MRKVCFVWGAFLVAQACGDSRGELREWQPSDHQPPPAQAPEGQGTGDEGGGDTGDTEARAAAALWGMRCARCHGAEGHGDGPERPPGAPIPDFTTPAFQDKYGDAELTEVIVKGRGLMPAFGNDLTEAGVAALVKHVRSLGGR